MTTKERNRIKALKALTALDDAQKEELEALEAKANEEEENEDDDEDEDKPTPSKRKHKRANRDTWPEVASLSDDVDMLKEELAKFRKTDWFPVTVAVIAIFAVFAFQNASKLFAKVKGA